MAAASDVVVDLRRLSVGAGADKRQTWLDLDTRQGLLHGAAAGQPASTRAASLLALANVAFDRANKPEMWDDAETRSQLLRGARAGEPRAVRIEALTALATLAADVPIMMWREVAAEGRELREVLLAAAGPDGDAAVRGMAAFGLASLCGSARLRPSLLEAGVADLLAEVLALEEPLDAHNDAWFRRALRRAVGSLDQRKLPICPPAVPCPASPTAVEAEPASRAPPPPRRRHDSAEARRLFAPPTIKRWPEGR